MTQDFNVWEGIYDSWEGSPGDNDASDDSVCLAKLFSGRKLQLKGLNH
ncbi:MAG: hypothetical protein H8E32_08260 [Nitrospinae bacterium]|nr:hypothetical protein [Nitrospinota bacterium]